MHWFSEEEEDINSKWENKNFCFPKTILSLDILTKWFRGTFLVILKVTREPEALCYLKNEGLIIKVESLVSKQASHKQALKKGEKIIGRYNPLSAFAWWKHAQQSDNGKASTLWKPV